MAVVDANILVYAADSDCPFQRPCLETLERLARGSSPWHLTWSIVYEFLRVSTHRRYTRNPWTIGKAWAFVGALLHSDSCSVLVATDRHAEVVSEVLLEMPQLAGSILHDAHTAILMREHGIRRIYTRDLHFHRFKFIEPIDPTG